MKAKHINFTEKGIDALPIPTKADGQQIYYDDGSQDGLMLIVTYGGTKTYYFYMFFNGRPVRVKIGRVGDIKLVAARKRAHTLREQASDGEDPTKKRQEELHDISLKDFYYNVYKPEYSLVFKKSRSVANDDCIFNHQLAEFQTRKLLSITTEDIEKLHNKVYKDTSPYTANRVLTLLKHMYTIAIKNGYMHGHPNPGTGIRKFNEKSRDRFLSPDELKRLYAALESEEDEVFRDYVFLSLYSGQRRTNVLTLRWEHVDFKNEFIYFPETKNGEPLTIPMTKQLYNLLTDIRGRNDSEWVIPSKKSASGHLEDPKRPWQNLLKRAGIENLRLHDLRRTQGSYQAISGSSLLVIGKTLGHKSPISTSTYARLDYSASRTSIQSSSDLMDWHGKGGK